MKTMQTLTLKSWLGVLGIALAAITARQALADPLNLSQVPLFLINNGTPNVLMMMGNANSMDEDATGAAVGSAASSSKSQIARTAMKSIITNNRNLVNLGLLAYQQNPATRGFLSASAYDVSYDPANYDPSYSGPRNGQTKRFRVPNSSSPGEFIYYNIGLPSYSTTDPGGNTFCVAASACTDATHDFKGTRQSGCATTEQTNIANFATVGGPWDEYTCYRTKKDPSNVAPATTGAAALAAGYSTHTGTYTYIPTTSDIGQGITDFGKLFADIYVDRAWMNNTSPGMGYMHTPLALLTILQDIKIKKKLEVSRPALDGYYPVHPNTPLQNSGLAPLEGTLLTAKNYFLGNTLPANQGGPVAQPPNSCGKNFLVLLTDGLPSVDKDGIPDAVVTHSLAAVATQATDLLGSTAAVKTYMLGFSLPYGVNPNQLDTIASAGGTGTAYMANDADSLNTAFTNIFNDIRSQVGAVGAVALNSSSVNSGSNLYQAKFNSQDWSGQLLSFALNSNGSVGASQWDAAQVVNSQDFSGAAATSRRILTYKPSNKKGIAFRWPVTAATPSPVELDSAQSTQLDSSPTTTNVDGYGARRLDYLRGSHVDESRARLSFRTRRISVLGDIVNSAPHYVGPPSRPYRDSSYTSFRNTKSARTPIIYVGANDGMLHGFNAADGAEVLAYIPSAVYPQLSQLTAAVYQHRYYVDGSPNSADVYYNSAWYSVLVSGMGAGAKGIFALNITDPSTFSEANAASIVNFEFPNKDTDNDDRNRVGYISGQIPIVKLNNGVYAAIFGNGYNSADGKASLFIVNVQTGDLIKRIDAGNSASNGLSNPAVIDADGNGSADYVYAGDLNGDMWKFDLSSTSSAAWTQNYKLFSGSNNAPITTTPGVSKHPNGDYLVYFGTGKYLEDVDRSNNPNNNFYGVWDHFGGTVALSDLVQQTVTTTSGIGGHTYRIVSNNAVNYSGTEPKRGWYLSLPDQGERSVTDAIVRGGRLIFTSMTPDSSNCAYGGNSWLMELDYLTGGMLTYAVLDTNNSGAVDASDQIVAGVKIVGISSAPAIVKDKPSSVDCSGRCQENKYLNISDGSTNHKKEISSGPTSHRSGWRQIPLK